MHHTTCTDGTQAEDQSHLVVPNSSLVSTLHPMAGRPHLHASSVITFSILFMWSLARFIQSPTHTTNSASISTPLVYHQIELGCSLGTALIIPCFRLLFQSSETVGTPEYNPPSFKSYELSSSVLTSKRGTERKNSDFGSVRFSPGFWQARSSEASIYSGGESLRTDHSRTGFIRRLTQ